jgi:transposase-like protein
MFADMLQHAVNAEFQRHLGAKPYERTPRRRGVRNGYKPRTLKTRVGSITLRIPQDRHGAFSPTLFERYQRSEKAFVLAMTEMYLQGISTRKVTEVVEALCGTTISASDVSLLTRKLDTELAAWRTRSLAHQAYPYLIIDAHYEKVRREGSVRSTAVLWVIGVSESGYREHLGVWSGTSESVESWSAVFQDLVARGLRGVRYIVSDEHAGLRAALTRYFPEAVPQRCQVHYQRNALSYVSSRETAQEVHASLRDVWSAPTRAEAEGRMQRLIVSLQKRLPKLATWLEETHAETLGIYAVTNESHRRRLRSTNSVEHDHAEVRRRTRVVRIFPNEASLIRLLTALAMDRNEQWMARLYFTMEESTSARLKQVA